MKDTPITKYTLLWLFLVAAHWSCRKECNPCNDPKLVTIPASDPSAPATSWQFSQGVRHGDGTVTSSISIVPTGTTVVNSTAADSITTNVYLTATDDQSGIKCIRLSGKGVVPCLLPGGGGFILDIIIPSDQICFDFTTCGIRRRQIDANNLGQYMKCNTGADYNSGSVHLTAIVENMKGVVDTSFLSVNFGR